MFEHLDDPAGFRPGLDLHQAAVARGRRLRRARRLVAAAGLALVAVTSVGVAGALYVERRDAAIDRVDVATEPSLDGATNILLVGTDPRPGTDVEGARADTIVVVRVEADGSLRLLSIPRDLIDPGTGGRMSASYSEGGRQGVVDAVRRVTGIPVDHYVELDFGGLVDLVDELGGLRLAVDRVMRDQHSGLDLQPSSCATLDGRATLALVRARHVTDGSGPSDPLSDLGRMARTQVVVTAAVSQLAGLDPGPGELDRLSRVLADHAVVDDELSLERMVDLGRAVAGGPGVVRSLLLPVIPDAQGGPTLMLAPDAPPVLGEFGARPASTSGGPTAPAGPASPTDEGAGERQDVPTGDATGIRPC